MENTKILRILFSLSALIMGSYFFLPDKKVAKEITSLYQDPEPQKMKGEKTSRREPASALILKADVYKPGITRSAVKESNYIEETAPGHFDLNSGGRSGQSPSAMTPQTRESNFSIHEPLISRPDSSVLPQKKNTEDPLPAVITMSPGKTKRKTPEMVSPAIPYVSGPPSSQMPELLQNTCTASLAAGSFNHPIGVTLSCASASVIHYCVSVDTGNGCCDPFTAGTVYSAKIGIGAANENYCLSFYGDSPLAGLSEVYEQSYTINSQLPDLQIGHQQIQYQTTQLAGKTFLTSLDFGKTGYGAGLINLKNHDPAPAAANLNCREIVESHSLLAASAPLEILSLLDVSLETPATQLEIPLRIDQLDYGTNFITGYMLNDNYDLPLYACSTSAIVLSDFEFYEHQLAFGDPGDNTTREFTGGLTSFGFFEAETDIYRGPAGSSTQDQSGQKLQYGMMGIFY